MEDASEVDRGVKKSGRLYKVVWADLKHLDMSVLQILIKVAKEG